MTKTVAARIDDNSSRILAGWQAALRTSGTLDLAGVPFALIFTPHRLPAELEVVLEAAGKSREDMLKEAKEMGGPIRFIVSRWLFKRRVKDAREFYRWLIESSMRSELSAALDALLLVANELSANSVPPTREVGRDAEPMFNLVRLYRHAAASAALPQWTSATIH